LLVRVVFVCFTISASAPSHYTVLSDRHLAKPDLCPIVSGLYPIVTWLSQVSVRSVGSLSDHHLAQPGLYPIMSGLYPIVVWLSRVSVRSCRVSVRSSFCSAGSLSDRVGSLSDRHFAQPLSSCGVSLARFIL
jgi:hypothetical protein